MYLLFRDFHIRPEDYFLAPEGVKIVYRAFLEKYQDERKKEHEELEKAKKRRH